jgi:hypothetical protein
MIKHDHKNKSSQIISTKDKFESHFSDHISHFETQRKNTLSAYFRRNSSQYSLQQTKSHQRELTDLYSSQQWLVHRISSNRTKKRNYCEQKLIIVMFSKKKEIKIFKTIKRFFSFIIVCYFKNLNMIYSFREIKKRNRLTLKNFHHIFQNVIAARQKNLELDSDYNSFSFKLFSSIISNQFFRKSIFDSVNDIDLFDLKVRSSSLFKSLNKSFDRHVSLKQLIFFVSSSRIQSSRNYERKHQNDFFIRNNAIEKFFRISNMTKRNERLINLHESLTLRRDRECRVNFKRSRVNLKRCDFDLNRFNHSREVSQDLSQTAIQKQDCEITWCDFSHVTWLKMTVYREK